MQSPQALGFVRDWLYGHIPHKPNHWEHPEAFWIHSKLEGQFSRPGLHLLKKLKTVTSNSFSRKLTKLCWSRLFGDRSKLDLRLFISTFLWKSHQHFSKVKKQCFFEALQAIFPTLEYFFLWNLFFKRLKVRWMWNEKKTTKSVWMWI